MEGGTHLYKLKFFEQQGSAIGATKESELFHALTKLCHAAPTTTKGPAKSWRSVCFGKEPDAGL